MPKKNPIPGMNPWLEAHWGDVHTRLTTYSADQLQSQLPPGLRARIEEYVTVESTPPDEDRPSRYAPDVRGVESHDALEPTGGVATAVATEEDPMVVRRLPESETLHRIEIVDTHDHERVVTSIEFISRANKSTAAGRDKFVEKRDRMLAGKVNVVEIDLLRGGNWVTAVAERHTPRAYREPYRICVVRAVNVDLAEIYKADFRTPLPTIKIPLRLGDDDVKLELQPLIDAAYINGGYGDQLDYGRPPQPELTPEEANWANTLLREAGVLTGGG